MSAGVVEPPDGRRVRGRGLRHGLDGTSDPEFGVYLTGRDPRIQGWPSRWVRWRDFRLPDSTEDALAALVELHGRARSERVEVACGGGVGRTGTALAVLAVLSGVESRDAIRWVRAHYHRRAVETPWQRRWIERAAASIVSDRRARPDTDGRGPTP